MLTGKLKLQTTMKQRNTNCILAFRIAAQAIAAQYVFIPCKLKIVHCSSEFSKVKCVPVCQVFAYG